MDLKDKVDLEEVISGFGAETAVQSGPRNFPGWHQLQKKLWRPRLWPLAIMGAEASRGVKRVEMTEVNEFRGCAIL